MDVAARIRELLDERKWKPYRLGKVTGLSPTTINNIFRRGTVPSIATLEIICKGFGITLSQFFAEGEDPIALTPDQRDLLDRWSCLTETQRQAVFQVIDNMSK